MQSENFGGRGFAIAVSANVVASSNTKNLIFLREAQGQGRLVCLQYILQFSLQHPHDRKF